MTYTHRVYLVSVYPPIRTDTQIAEILGNSEYEVEYGQPSSTPICILTTEENAQTLEQKGGRVVSI